MGEIAKKDSLILITTLGVSYYNTTVLCRVKKDFDPKKEMFGDFAKHHTIKYPSGDSEPDYTDFFFWLEKNGFIEELPYSELIIGEDDEDLITFYPGSGE